MHKYLFCLFGLIFFGCSESTITPDESNSDNDYFPLEKGDFRIYDVEEILFNVLGSDTSHYQLKESVVDSFLNSTSEFSYVINRETRLTESESWSLDSVWTARKSNSFVVSVENNLNIIKMVFPIEHGISWNGNELNSKNEKLFSYNLNVPDTVLFDSTYSNIVKVVQSDIPENLINRDERTEFYAKDVGMILKSSTILEFCQQDCPATKSIESGRIFKATLMTYGKE